MLTDIEQNFIISFNALADELHQTAKNKGFWDKERNDGEAIMLMVSELSEALEALREGDPVDQQIGDVNGMGFRHCEVELADVIIRIMDFAKGKNHNVAGAIVFKSRFNKNRPYKHGKKF